MAGAYPNTSSNLRNSSLCDECGSNPWKYRCPGCLIRSCSLPCVNSHKKRTSCTGKRSYTEFVPLSQFNDNILLSDYNLLEETKRVADSARRMVSGFRGCCGFKLPTKLWMLRNAARRRRIWLSFFPAGMSKSETNQSRYDRRKNTIFWTLELRFHGTDVVLVHHGVDEHASLLSIIGKHLAPGPWNHKLRSFCDVQLDDLKLFLRKYPKGSKSPFRKLDIKAPIGSQMANIVILEYPVIFVFLPSHDYDFEVEKGRMPFVPFLRNTAPSTFDSIPSLSGTLYSVEEVEEGDMPSDTRITDLMDSRKSAANCLKVPEDANVPSNTWVAKEIAKADNAVHFTDKQIPEATAGGFRHELSGKTYRALTPNSPESGDAGFYFEQELRDAYSDLIGEMNPDDFLCLDGIYNDSEDLGEARWYEMGERKRDDTEEIRDVELDEVTGDAFEIRVGDDLGESKGNDDLKEKLVGHLEERQGNELKGRRTIDLEEKRENSFLSGGLPFGEMELEEGEIPCFL